MAIMLEVKADLSALREATVDEIVEATGCSADIATALTERFWVIPR